jgi:magnesium transporter
MNFNPEAGPLNMPELNFRYGYAAFWFVVICTAFGMWGFFRRKKWL